MDELEVEVTLSTVRIRLCSGLEVVPVIFSAVEVLQSHGEGVCHGMVVWKMVKQLVQKENDKYL